MRTNGNGHLNGIHKSANVHQHHQHDRCRVEATFLAERVWRTLEQLQQRVEVQGNNWTNESAGQGREISPPSLRDGAVNLPPASSSSSSNRNNGLAIAAGAGAGRGDQNLIEGANNLGQIPLVTFENLMYCMDGTIQNIPQCPVTQGRNTMTAAAAGSAGQETINVPPSNGNGDRSVQQSRPTMAAQHPHLSGLLTDNNNNRERPEVGTISIRGRGMATDPLLVTGGCHPFRSAGNSAVVTYQGNIGFSPDRFASPLRYGHELVPLANQPPPPKKRRTPDQPNHMPLYTWRFGGHGFGVGNGQHQHTLSQNNINRGRIQDHPRENTRNRMVLLAIEQPRPNTNGSDNGEQRQEPDSTASSQNQPQ